MPSYQYRNSHCGDKTIVRWSYLHNGEIGMSYNGKMASLYWISPKHTILIECLLWSYYPGAFSSNQVIATHLKIDKSTGAPSSKVLHGIYYMTGYQDRQWPSGDNLNQFAVSLRHQLIEALEKNHFQANFSDWWPRYCLWNCPQINVTGPYWLEGNIGSVNSLAPSGN